MRLRLEEEEDEVEPLLRDEWLGELRSDLEKAGPLICVGEDERLETERDSARVEKGWERARFIRGRAGV